MQIFLPFKKDLNPYLDEIIRCSQHSYSYDYFKNYKDSYSIVNIHWPEAIFNWKEPSEDQLKELEEAIATWKKNSVLVYTKHDFQRNKGTTANFTRLFRLIEKNADVFIHLGEFSNKFYKQKYRLAQHYIIYHPLYTHSFKVPDKNEARRELNIDEDATVIIAPGNIRTYAERDMVLRAFKALNIENKVLIATNVHSELRYDFPGRVRLKKIFDIKKSLVNSFRRKYREPQFLFTYSTLPKRELELKMAAADVVLIPRINILNSGNVFLGLTFKKIIVGPDCGNIAEQLKELNYPVFNPYSRSSVTSALAKGIELGAINNSETKAIYKYIPGNVAKEYDMVFLKYGSL